MLTTRAAGRPMLHTLHAILLAYPIALFTAALVADAAYLRTAEIQWSNFASWLIVGALAPGGLVLAWAVRGLAFSRRANRIPAALYCGLIIVMWGAEARSRWSPRRTGRAGVGAGLARGAARVSA